MSRRRSGHQPKTPAEWDSYLETTIGRASQRPDATASLPQTVPDSTDLLRESAPQASTSDGPFERPAIHWRDRFPGIGNQIIVGLITAAVVGLVSILVWISSQIFELQAQVATSLPSVDAAIEKDLLQAETRLREAIQDNERSIERLTERVNRPMSPPPTNQ